MRALNIYVAADTIIRAAEIEYSSTHFHTLESGTLGSVLVCWCMLLNELLPANYQQVSVIPEVLENNYSGAYLPTGLPEKRDGEGHKKNGEGLN